MAFENDPEGRRLAAMYAGSDFDQTRTVEHMPLCKYSGEWSLDEFQTMLANAIATIPAKLRATAKVEMYEPGYDGSTSLRLTYRGPESAEDVADRVRRCEQYVAASRSYERRTYERLKAKFGG
jgi:hypothetical protein